ncbi:glycosyltransferase family 2 protein [Alteromonas macleodii]|mgnify:FL=1|uniref:Glycosyl transferase 2 family protein n=1 Tax=Alteromonas macleodii TaxID=28108 RepID=A0AB36G2K4_ALTMA|nr:glycosyltransferase [Alteromonas macleodii]MEC8374541.1 glycosyltransferase [Pseudomonadota bacterium]OES34059.1 glycosyl transferase 2 family protein [Alteromonas macleodii]OES35407.1 glycosyl transferase 2 family protein [Alteromonas macleodii]OES37134.1 glycosyl transferase 2 family protein [Alteromonas macleodii]OES42609.1 glycosyl transferase 2 family protein [Alteromonas macleodii]|tara:strand:- start:2488 stop:3519 length:1032 start_codon:yes stop_codon:yes gene_type:complete
MVNKVTALMTTFNASKWVEETIDSVLSQTYPNFEFLIVDDGSTDNTKLKVEGFSDPRIKFITYKENKGVGYRLDDALDLVTTPYIAKVDADDISEPNRFEEQLRFIESREADIVKCHLNYFADTDSVANSSRFTVFKTEKERAINDIASPDDINASLRQWPCFPHTTYFAKTAVLKRVRYPRLRIFEDYVLFLRLLNQGFKFDCLEKSLVKMRISDSSTTMSLSQNDFDEGLIAVIEEKSERLIACTQGKQVYVYGAGKLARSFVRHAHLLDREIVAFVDKKDGETSDVIVSETKVPIISLERYLSQTAPKALIVAAQPVRSEITSLLSSLGKKEGHDFYVLA